MSTAWEGRPRRRVAACLLAAVLLGGAGVGCATTTAGSGRTVAARAGVATAPDTAGSAPSTPGSTTTGSSTTLRFPRATVRTVIGDPPTADLCTAFGTAEFTEQGLYAGALPQQYSGSCEWSISLSGDEPPSYEAGALALEPGTGRERDGGTTSERRGTTVITYPYDPGTSECARRVLTRSVTFELTGNADDGSGSSATSCRIADAVTTRVIALVHAHRAVPRVQTATPSVTGLDVCAALSATSTSGLSDFATPSLEPAEWGSVCIGQTTNTTYVVQTAIDQDTSGPSGDKQIVDGHTIVDSLYGDSCTVTSLNDRAGSIGREQIEISARTTADTSSLCTQTVTLLSRLLTTSGIA